MPAGKAFKGSDMADKSACEAWLAVSTATAAAAAGPAILLGAGTGASACACTRSCASSMYAKLGRLGAMPLPRLSPLPAACSACGRGSTAASADRRCTCSALAASPSTPPPLARVLQPARAVPLVALERRSDDQLALRRRSAASLRWRLRRRLLSRRAVPLLAEIVIAALAMRRSASTARSSFSSTSRLLADAAIAVAAAAVAAAAAAVAATLPSARGHGRGVAVRSGLDTSGSAGSTCSGTALGASPLLLCTAPEGVCNVRGGERGKAGIDGAHPTSCCCCCSCCCLWLVQPLATGESAKRIAAGVLSCSAHERRTGDAGVGGPRPEGPVPLLSSASPPLSSSLVQYLLLLSLAPGSSLNALSCRLWLRSRTDGPSASACGSVYHSALLPAKEVRTAQLGVLRPGDGGTNACCCCCRATGEPPHSASATWPAAARPPPRRRRPLAPPLPPVALLPPAPPSPSPPPAP
eukprot:250757-Chlamydomonas_euryale.AAC.27